MFEGSYFYLSSDIEVESEILANTYFVTDSLEVLRLQEFYLKSYLFDDLGNPMVNQSVNVTFEGQTYQLFTDSEGYVEKNLTLSSTHSLGIYTATWSFVGYQYYLPSDKVQTIVVVACLLYTSPSPRDRG